MKKLLAFIIALMLSVTLVSCDDDKKEEDVSSSEANVGGWMEPESTDVSKEVKNLLNKATANLAGGTYEPVAYIGSQVVAGTNHRILCKYTPATKDPKSTYAIVTVYEDLEGNAEIIEILNSDAEVLVTDKVIDGGWFAPKSPELTKEVLNVLSSATENIAGASYKPVVFLGTQIVAGFNYCLLCEVKPATENAQSHYSIVLVYQGADGKTSVLETHDFVAENAE